MSSLIAASVREQQIRLLIAERNRLAGQLLAESLQRDPRFQATTASGYPASVGSELLTLVATRKPELVVISSDFDSAPKKGLHVARTLNALHPGIRIVILLDVPTRESVMAAFHSGARGVFCRTEPLPDLHNCLERVSRGEIWVGSTEADYLLEAIRNRPSCESMNSDKLSKLSRREIEVAEHAVRGETNKQIASQLRLSQHTVKNYIFRVFEKLEVSNRMELLFLLSNYMKKDVGSRSAPGSPFKSYLKKATDGSAPAQFMVGVAYYSGCGVERNEQSAYYWLRRAEEGLSKLRERSHILLEDIKARMGPRDIQALERRVNARKNKDAAETIAEAAAPGSGKIKIGSTAEWEASAGNVRQLPALHAKVSGL